MTVTAFAVMAFAVYRITRLIVVDTVWERSRGRFLVWLDARGARGRKTAEMLSCTWCAGWWVSLVVYVAFMVAAGEWSSTPLVVHGVSVFAVAGAAALLSTLDPT